MRNCTKIYLFLLVVLTSCGEYVKVSKSSDYELKYTYAKKYYEQKKYSRAFSLFEEIVPIYKGTEKAEESLYLLAKSYYGAKDYETAAIYFSNYYKVYPRGEYNELSRFYSAESYYRLSPEAELDQTPTMKAINEFQMFLEYYPQSDKSEDAREYITSLRDKLAEKEYLSSKLYFNLGNYMGNNYRACVITAQNALRNYPDFHRREDLYMLILKAKYEEAHQSVVNKKNERFRDVIDEYYNYKNEYPEGKYIKEANGYLKTANKIVGNTPDTPKIDQEK